MKKLFAFIATLLLFAACSSDAASFVKPMQPEAQTPKSSANSSAQTEALVKLKIYVNDTTFTATLEENSSATALKELLQKGDLTLDMEDFSNFEKVADLPTTLPRNDTQIDTDAGDLILYLGKRIVIYYDKNSWNFTRLGKIDGATKDGLKKIFGKGKVTAALSLRK